MNTRSERILIIAEHADDELLPISLELITCAREIGQCKPVTIRSVLAGQGLTLPSKHISLTGTDVIAIEIPEANNPHPALRTEAIKPVIRDFRPTIIIAGHTSAGTDLLPGLAIGINASCITGIRKISDDSGELLYVRSILNGKFDAAIRSDMAITAISVLPGAFESASHDGREPGNITNIIASDIFRDPRIRLENVTRISASSDFSFDDADVIVAAGRGIGKMENLDKIREFAALLPRSAVAGSRPLIDCGWLAYRHQVGITGKTVTPKVYIACGISGSSQHIAGMSGAEFVISVNTDPDAAIFNVSDVRIVENLIPFLEEVIRQMKS